MIRLAKVALAFPRAAVFMGLVLTALLAAGIPSLELRTDGDTFPERALRQTYSTTIEDSASVPSSSPTSQGKL